MKITGSTELARMQMLQRQTIDSRNSLDRAAKEMSTGLKADRFKATGGNLARLFTVERMLERNTAYQHTITMTELRIDVMQEGLGRILDWAGSLAVDLTGSTGIGDLNSSMIHARAARGAFIDTVATLNGQINGQSLYAGVATDGPALARGEDMLAQLNTLVAGAATAADAVAIVEGYFQPPAGDFFASGYLGSTIDVQAAEVGEGERLDYAVRADAAELVATLRGLALGAVVADGLFAGSVPDRLEVLSESGRQLLNAKEGMLDLRARVGVSQFALESAKAQRISERETYSMARARIVATDPYEAASAFQALQAQLDTVFTVTARLSTLRFSNYMR